LGSRAQWLDVEDIVAKSNISFEAKVLPISNATFQLALTLSKTAPVNITLYNTLGQAVSLVQKGQLPAGEHTFEFVSRSSEKGIYWCRIQVGKEMKTLPFYSF
jgi:hypothetical protein